MEHFVTIDIQTGTLPFVATAIHHSHALGKELEELSALHVMPLAFSCRKVLRAIPLQPRYLASEAAQKRLDTLRQGLSIFELLQRRSR